MPHAPPRPPAEETDLQGWGRLPFDATLGLVDLVEAMHQGIARLPGTGAGPATGRTRGLTGLVYRIIRGVTRAADAGVRAGLSLAPRGRVEPSARREAVLAALNGVLGDHLVASGNPLAIPMQLWHGGQPLVLERAALAAALPGAGGRPLVLVHGSCLSDASWRRGGHDHGAALAEALGCTPLFLRYNSGLHVSTNGRELARLLEGLCREWPVPLVRLDVVAHSMGGLVARSACHHAAAAGQAWLGHLRGLAFLGTPHLGAPLERGGSFVDTALGLNRYAAPLARLGKIRSAGVTDLRHGSLLDEDWAGPGGTEGRLPRPVPLPEGVRCFAVAGTTADGSALAGRLVGDGLVPVDSALGRSDDPARALGFPEGRTWIGRGLGHLDLLSSPAVAVQLRGWLAG